MKADRKYGTLYLVVGKVGFIIVVLAAWECAAKAKAFGNNSELVFPTLETIGRAFIDNFIKGYGGISLFIYVGNSLKLLMEGLAIGIILAFLFSGLSIISDKFRNIFELIITVCDLLPGVAILPVVIVIFGIKPEIIIFLVIHAVLWPMSRNILDGFKAVPKLYIEVGQNIGLKGRTLLWGVYLPASVSYIVSGLKVGWARAWRGLISAEMIFGVASCPGIGLYINLMRMNMKNAEMYATLIVIIAIGFVVQYLILEPIENHTVKKWGISK